MNIIRHVINQDFVTSLKRQEKIKLASKKLKVTVSKKRTEYFNALHKKLHDLKSRDSQEYWKLLNNSSKSRSQNIGIELEALREHFAKLSNKPVDNTPVKMNLMSQLGTIL